MTPALSWNPPRQDLGKPHLLGPPWCWHLLQHKLLRDIGKPHLLGQRLWSHLLQHELLRVIGQPHLLGQHTCLWQDVAISWP